MTIRNLKGEYFYPEYESVKKLCEKTGISYKEAYHMAVRG